MSKSHHHGGTTVTTSNAHTLPHEAETLVVTSALREEVWPKNSKHFSPVAGGVEKKNEHTTLTKMPWLAMFLVALLHNSEMYPDVEDKCDECHGCLCNLGHMFFFFALNSMVFGLAVATLPLWPLSLESICRLPIFRIPDALLPLNSIQKDFIAYTSLLDILYCCNGSLLNMLPFPGGLKTPCCC